MSELRCKKNENRNQESREKGGTADLLPRETQSQKEKLSGVKEMRGSNEGFRSDAGDPDRTGRAIIQGGIKKKRTSNDQRGDKCLTQKQNPLETIKRQVTGGSGVFQSDRVNRDTDPTLVGAN